MLFERQECQEEASFKASGSMKGAPLTAFERSFDALNRDESHFACRNDICTPMACVQEMVETIPKAFWRRKGLRILDPCAGNGNFHAYIQRYAAPGSLVFNEINDKRIANIKSRFGADACITQRDFLAYAEDEKFDLIVANPPYAKFDSFGARVSKNHNLSRDFMGKALRLLKEGGLMLFIVPDNWMSLAIRNKLPAALSQFQFLHLNIHGAKRHFTGVGSSFTWFLLRKTPNRRPFTVVNNYVWQDTVQARLTPGARYVPLYLNDTVRGLFEKCIDADNEKQGIETNCDLHRYTRSALIASQESPTHPYRLIHTPKQTVWAARPHKYQQGWKVFLSLSDRYGAFVDNCGMTQSIAYIRCKSEREARARQAELQAPLFRLLNDLTRYGNFNNVKILASFPRLHQITLTPPEQALVSAYERLLQCRN